MAMPDIAGLQLTNLTAYNEYITDVIIAVIVYLSAFSLVIKMLLDGRKKRKAVVETPAVPTDEVGERPAEPAPEQIEEGGEKA